MATTPQQFLFKVWSPGQAPTDHEPTLILYNQAAIHFFVESIANGSKLFAADKPFAVCAYYLSNEIMERPVAEGTFRFCQEGHTLRLYTLYEAGSLAAYGNCGVISAALLEARMQIEPEQVL